MQQIHEAWSAGVELPALQSAATKILVFRREEEVFQRALSEVEAHALDCIREGQAFGTVCAGVAEMTGEAGAAVSAVGMLERWLAEGILRAFDLGPTLETESDA